MKWVLDAIIGNSDILKACSRHSFDIDLNKERVAGKRWKCSNCGGEVDEIKKSWYEKGLEHGEEIKERDGIVN